MFLGCTSYIQITWSIMNHFSEGISTAHNHLRNYSLQKLSLKYKQCGNPLTKRWKKCSLQRYFFNKYCASLSTGKNHKIQFMMRTAKNLLDNFKILLLWKVCHQDLKSGGIRGNRCTSTKFRETSIMKVKMTFLFYDLELDKSRNRSCT